MVNDSQATGITYIETKVLENITAELEETERYYKTVVRQKNNIITTLEKEAKDNKYRIKEHNDIHSINQKAYDEMNEKHKKTIRELIKELDKANQ